MPKPAIILLAGNETDIDLSGTAQRAAGFNGTAINGGWHTISADLVNFTGKIYIEASLSTSPTESDWFAVPLTEPGSIDGGGADFTNLIEFTATTSTVNWEVRGNFVWIRARIERSYLPSADGIGYPRKIQMVI